MSKTPIADKAIPAGLKVWLFFLLTFIFLGLPVVLSILFGFLGGIAGGWILAWWQTPGGEPFEMRSPEEIERAKRRSGPPGLRLTFFNKSLDRPHRRSSRIRRRR
ncbi:MAG: hypothetical protein QNJ46_12490 [Leptolyngbyaceae cyanobacterium MO_188.B28]|nr:hypothetical protein [Leptolyngbyaceae cyanobacterium MO_188.B28]